jgi:hypothetical protein
MYINTDVSRSAGVPAAGTVATTVPASLREGSDTEIGTYPLRDRTRRAADSGSP